MSDEEFVKQKYPQAVVGSSLCGGLWIIYDSDKHGCIYGSGRDEKAAWADARARIEATPERCKDCDDCARHAYSDATTPGFFYDKCEKHRKPAEPVSQPACACEGKMKHFTQHDPEGCSTGEPVSQPIPTQCQDCGTTESCVTPKGWSCMNPWHYAESQPIPLEGKPTETKLRELLSDAISMVALRVHKRWLNLRLIEIDEKAGK